MPSGILRGLLVLLLLALPVCHADVPDARQDCLNRNAARCEMNGIPFMHDGPCPAPAKTLHPAGREDCTKLPFGRPEIRLAEPAPPPVAAPRTDLAYIGQIERWLLPLVVIGGSLLLGGLAVFLLVRHRRQTPNAAGGGAGHTALVLLGSVPIGLFTGYHAAGFAFTRVDASFGNHDSAGPVLIAGAAALLVFIVVAQLAFAASALTLRALFSHIRRPD